MNKGLAIFAIAAIILAVGCFIPSVNAQESKAYSRYKLIDSWVSGGYKTCLYRNIKGQTKSTSVSKGKVCPKVY